MHYGKQYKIWWVGALPIYSITYKVYSSTYSFPIGTEPRRFGFCTILAWFFSVMLILDGNSRHGSPSTCIGIVLYVVSSTCWH